jgi:hypothetical protein
LAGDEAGGGVRRCGAATLARLRGAVARGGRIGRVGGLGFLGVAGAYITTTLRPTVAGLGFLAVAGLASLGNICRAGWAKWATGPRAGTWAASCQAISCRVGPTLLAEVAAQHSSTSCSCRPRPEKIMLGSCLCRAKLSCFGPAHGPHAFLANYTLSSTSSKILHGIA